MALKRLVSGGSWVLAVLLLTTLSEVTGQLKPAPVCELIPPNQSPPGREFPRLPAAFQTNVELNIVNKQVTVVAYESFDLPNNRSFLSLTKDVRQTKSYVDYNTQEVHVVYEKTKCKSVPLDTSDERVLLGQVVINGVRYTYSVVSALKFGQEFGQHYMGRDTVRGIPSDHWNSCQHWDEPAANFTVDYYFAIPEWTQTMGASAMPVRVVVEGLSSHGSEGLHSFKHVYDFTSFQPYADKDAGLYQTPDGVYCEDRQKTRPVPKLPQSFRYRTEIVQPWSSLNTGIIFNMDFWYDYDHKLGRYDFALPIPLSFIFDYRIGVRYMKSVREGTCKMVGFGLWSKGPPGNNQLILEMLDPEHIFFLDDSYVYTGKVTQRGIPCDRFITRKTFGTDEMSWNATMEYCIIDRTFVEIGDSATTTTQEVPMTLKFAAGGFAADMNHFDFEHIDMADDMKMFDVADCYNPGDRKDIRITFDASYVDKISMYKGKFISDVIARIAKVARVSPIRVQRPRVDFDVSKTYFTSTLLNRVPFDVLFSPNEEGDTVGLVSVDDQVDDVRFEQLCAEMCQDMVDDKGTPIKCNGFAYCFADNRCLLSTNHVARPGTVNVGSYCRADTVKYYNRVVPAPEMPDVRLSTAMTSLKNSILAGDFKIYFKPNDGDELRIYQASEIKTGFTRGDGEGTEKLVRDFNQIRQRIIGEKYIKVDIDTGLSLDECAGACERKDNFVCQSFAFCGNVGKCLLAAEHPEEKTDMLLNTTSCDVYSRNYLQKFKHFMGRVLPQKDAVTLLKVASWERCAVLCVTQKGWACKSFDYCIASQTCRLNKRHMLDTPAREGSLKPAPDCHHFSRLYIDDFRQTSSDQIIALKDVNVLRDVDTTQCAKMCVENLGNECKGFDYCGNETFCVLSSKYYRDKGIGKVVTADTAVCSHYSRTSFPDGSAYVPQKTVNQGYSGGAMFGMAIGMLVLGMLLLVLIAGIIIKVRGGSTDDMKTALVSITNPVYAN